MGLETASAESMLAVLIRKSTTLEVVVEHCKAEKFKIGESGLFLLRRDPNELGLTNVGFGIVGFYKLARACRKDGAPVTLIDVLNEISREHPETKPAIDDVVIQMAKDSGACNIMYI